MKYRIIALAVIFALLAGVIAEFGCTGPGLEFMIYEVKPVTVLPVDVQNLAVTLFAPNETPALNETSELYYVSADPYYLECCKNSGSIWYADKSKAYNEFYEPEKLPSEEDARDIADQFLASLIEDGVIPEEVEFQSFDVGETETGIFGLATNETVTWINHLDVLYSFGELDGIPVWGPGAKIRVSIGDDEDGVIGLHYVWREIEKAFGAYPAISKDDAIEIFKETLGGEPEELKVDLVYFAESEYEKQEFLQPYYLFGGTMMVEGEEVNLKPQLVPATTFSPRATIVSPEKYAEFDEGDIITFNASVLGGTPPYYYVWESHVDGVVGTAASFSTDSLSVGERGGEVLPHIIYLTVTDGNGNQGIDLIPVKVVPVQSTSILTIAPPPEEIQTPSNTPSDDPQDNEVGIEWVGFYPNQAPVWWADKEARRFAEELVADGWVLRFDWGESAAREEDFKYYSHPDQGIDFLEIDKVDFAWFTGHGTYYNICFSDSEHDKDHFDLANARWGGNSEGFGEPWEPGDLEWIVLDSCLTLYCDREHRWHTYARLDQAFDGLHILMGYSSEALSSAIRGRAFAEHMIEGQTVREAWIRVTQGTGPSTIDGLPVEGAYMRASSELWPSSVMMEFLNHQGTGYDHLPGHGYVSPDPYPVRFLIYYSWKC